MSQRETTRFPGSTRLSKAEAARREAVEEVEAGENAALLSRLVTVKRVASASASGPCCSYGTPPQTAVRRLLLSHETPPVNRTYAGNRSSPGWIEWTPFRICRPSNKANLVAAYRSGNANSFGAFSG